MLSGRNKRLALLGGAATTAAIALAACGGDGSQATGGSTPVGDVRAGSAAPLAQCRDWRRGTVGERRATVRDVQGRHSEEAGAPEPALSEDEVYQLFERACEEQAASSIRLYKIYFRALAFEPLTE